MLGYRNLSRLLLLAILLGAVYGAPVNPSQAQPQNQQLQSSLNDVKQSIYESVVELFNTGVKSAASMLSSFVGQFCAVQSSLVLLDFLRNAAIASVFVLLLGILKYMISKNLGHELSGISSKAHLSIAIEHIIFTFLIAFIVIFFASAFNVYDFFGKAEEFINLILTDITFIFIGSTLLLRMFSNIMHISFDIPVTPDSVISVPLALGQIFKPLVDTISIINYFISAAQIEWMIKFFAICFTKSYALTLLFPLGIIMRSIQVTEGFGNSLIALSISFSFIYPMLLSANYEIYNAIVGDPSIASGRFDVGLRGELANSLNTFATAVLIGIGSVGVLGGISSLYKYFPNNKVKNKLDNFFNFLKRARAPAQQTPGGGGAVTSKVTLFSRISGFMTGPGKYIFGVVSAYLAAKVLISMVHFGGLIFVVFSLFLTIINIYIVLSFAYEISKLLRTPLELGALMRMI